jgi:methylated-DNA-[protein]-cysteine S-methyltransferase
MQMAGASPDRFTLDRISTPIGVGLIITDSRGALCAYDWTGYEDRMMRLFRNGKRERASLVEGRSPVAVRSALERYFDGDVHAIDSLPCAASGTTFQKRCWDALRAIPAGRTATYGEQAKNIGSPSAARAVGLANNRNPIALVVPCHRVIGANGSLTGYAGGLERKQWLLDHEARHANQPTWMASTARASSTSSAESLSIRATSAR